MTTVFPGMYLYLCPHLRLLSRTFSGMYSYFRMWRMSVNATKWTFLTFCFLCAFFMTSFHSVSIVAFSSGINIAWDERLLFVLLGFPRHASPRDLSPESSEPHVTLDSRSSLIRTTFGVHTSFFPGSHLRVSRTHRILRFT